MRTKRFLLVIAGLLPALLLSGAAVAQDVPLDVEVGYRWSDVSGNEEMFRSQLDERAGLQLRSLSYGLGDIRDSKAIDHFRIDAADLGIGPNGLLRLEAGRTGFWKLNASYRRTEHYSNLPTIANPFLEKGTLDSQHSFDRTRNSVDVDLELLPGKAVRPLLGFSYSRYAGPGLTTYHVGQDDFRLDQDLENKDTEYRIGVAFDAGAFSGQVVQGWRQFRGEETLKLSPGAGAGNNPGTILGVPITLSSLSRTAKTDIDTPVTSAVVTGKLGTAVRLTGTYVRAKADGEDDSNEALSGSLVSYDILRYFKALAEQTSATSEALSWRGNLRADIHISNGFDVAAGYTRRSRELDGYGLVNDLYGTTTTFSGFDPKDVATILQSKTRVKREEDIFDVRASLKVVGPFSIRLGYSENQADITVANDPSEVVVTWGQGGQYDRRVRTLNGGLLFNHSGLTLGLDYVAQDADNAVVRTDFLERDRLRLRGAWEPVKWIRIGATAEQIDTTNDDAGYGLEGTVKTYAGDLEVGPWEWLRVRVGAGRFEGDNSISYRQPQDWVNGMSIYRERGDSLEGGITLNVKPITLEALLRRFENDGSFPYELDRARVRADFEFSKLIGIVAEWDLDDYTEKDRTYGSGADYRANRYGLYLRIHP
jgi:hypothetical protein